MIETGEKEANLDEKEWSALLNFQTVSENFDCLAKAMIVTEFLFYVHYNQLDRFAMNVSGYNEKILMFQLYNWSSL